MLFRRIMVSVLAFWVVATLLPTSAFASEFKLRVEELTAAKPNGVGVVVTDGGPGDQSPGPEGVILLQLSTGSIAMSGTTGITKPLLPNPGGPPTLFLQTFVLTSTGPATVRLTLEDIGYPGGGGPNLLQLNSQILFGNFSAPAGSTVTITSWANPLNTAPALGPDNPVAGFPPQAVPGDLLAIGANQGASTAQTFTSANPTFEGTSAQKFAATQATYAMYSQVDIYLSAAGSVSFDHITTVTATDELVPDPVPEPGSLLLIATGVLGLARAKWRRSSSKNQAV